LETVPVVAAAALVDDELARCLPTPDPDAPARDLEATAPAGLTGTHRFAAGVTVPTDGDRTGGGGGGGGRTGCG